MSDQCHTRKNSGIVIDFLNSEAERSFLLFFSVVDDGACGSFADQNAIPKSV